MCHKRKVGNVEAPEETVEQSQQSDQQRSRGRMILRSVSAEERSPWSIIHRTGFGIRLSTNLIEALND